MTKFVIAEELRVSENSIYYKEITKSCDKPYACFYYSIRWNVENITGKKAANGYIVQYVYNENTTTINGVSKDPYYEAWKVENGIVVDTIHKQYDDVFEFGEFFEWEQIENSLGKRGIIRYKTKVFWIDVSNPYFNNVDAWEDKNVYAGGLKATLAIDCNFLADRDSLFKRKFEHVVDFSNKDTIKKALLDYRNRSSMDDKKWEDKLIELLSNTAYESLISEILRNHNN